MALRRELRMSDKNKKCILTLLISLMTLLILQHLTISEPVSSKSMEDLDYTYSESDIKETIKQQVREKIEAALQSANSYFQANDDCGSDQDFESINDQLDQYLTNRKQCLLKYCGDVCKTKDYAKKATHDTNIDDDINKEVGKLQSGNYANLKVKRKHFDCGLLFKSKVHDLSAPTFMKKPFRDIPKILNDDYTYDGRIRIKKYYIGNNFPTNRSSKVSFQKGDKFGKKYQWSKDSIDERVKAVQAKKWGKVGGAYGAGETKVLFETISLYKDKVFGKRALVIGSVIPWVEAILLAIGAKHVTTLEYNQITSTHPQHEAILPSDISSRFLVNEYKPMYDVIVSFSSIEHSGLTRYGDAPHPWGDLVTMAKNWCYLVNDGIAFIGVPTAQIDTIHFNAHRFYGPLMLSHLFANWNLKFASWPYKGNGGGRQVTFVIEKELNT